MKKIIYKIRFFIEVYIIFPIKRWWNYHVKGLYVPNNMRSQALLEYCEKILFNYLSYIFSENYNLRWDSNLIHLFNSLMCL